MCGHACCLVVFGVLASSAWAGTDDGPAVQAAARQETAQAVTQATTRPALPATASSADTLGFGPAADLGKLEKSRGGTETHSNANLSGVVSNNTAVNVVTGNNVIDAGSFANMSGIPVVIQNSGANVLIQNSMIVNLQMK